MNTVTQGLSVLIASPEMASRTKLREILNSFLYKGRLDSERSLDSILNHLTSPAQKKVDLLFLASSFGRKELISFMDQARSHLKSKMPPAIVFLNSSVLDKTAEVAALYLAGIDGFISEPYSHQELSLLIESLLSGNKEAVDPKDKMKKAAEFLLTDAMGHVDALAKQVIAGSQPGGYPLKDLRHISGSLKTLFEQSPDEYANALFAAFQRAEPFEARQERSSARRATKAVHPGSIVRELMQARQFSVERITQILHLEKADLELLLGEKMSINEALAQTLSLALGKTPREWLRLQSEYDLSNPK